MDAGCRLYASMYHVLLRAALTMTQNLNRTILKTERARVRCP